MIDTTMNGCRWRQHVLRSVDKYHAAASLFFDFSTVFVSVAKEKQRNRLGREKSICDVTYCKRMRTATLQNGCRSLGCQVRSIKNSQQNKINTLNTFTCTYLFPTFQPSTTRALFQYFALVFRILAAFPWRLMFGFVIHMTPRHYKCYNFHSSVKSKNRTTCALENRLLLALHLYSISV